MPIYASENSEYEIKNGNLVKDSNGKILEIGPYFVYTSDKPLLKILKEKNISLSQLEHRIEISIGNSILKALGEGMDKNTTGGRFFALVKKGNKYAPVYSGKILEIDKEDSDEVILLDSDKDSKLGLDFADIDKEIEEQYGSPKKP